MTNEEVTETTDQPSNQDVQISIEQICAAILNTIGSVEVSLESLMTDYSSKNISVNQDPETKALTFALADQPAVVDAPVDTDSDEETNTESE